MLRRNCENEKGVGTDCCTPVLVQGCSHWPALQVKALIRAVWVLECLNGSRGFFAPACGAAGITCLCANPLLAVSSWCRRRSLEFGLGPHQFLLTAGLCFVPSVPTLAGG